MSSKKTISSNLISKKPGYYRPRRKKSSKKEETTPASTSSSTTGLFQTRSTLSQGFLEKVEDARNKFPSLENTEEYVQFFKRVGFEAEKNPTKSSYERVALSSDPRFDTYLEEASNLPPGYIVELPEIRGVCFLALYYRLVQSKNGEEHE